ncbi:uncharacterized protein BX664DRAFT_195393 [Halteromyces radiatus]|uniref:uncharacterized protein n=1 Tax=Halteromyces radiatus TaxID=101107 RepID=UPI00221EB131|nr:uncharacterized protein BX664DRAFT_195393 [Halteromyces radiatus]KAI8081512.1 hypothetical protein BX664DRAFT_195393 [Halteromyces radiatus]
MSKVIGNERISQILPTVKCSDCGRDVQLRQLGNHICSNMPPVPALPILPPEKYGKKPSTTTKTNVLPISPRSPDGYYSARTDNNKYNNNNNKTSPYYDHSSPLSNNLIYAKSSSPYDRYRNDDNDYSPSTTYQRQQPSPPQTSNRYNDDYYSPKTPTYLNSSNEYLPRKNSTSPAPPESPSPKSPYFK